MQELNPLVRLISHGEYAKGSFQADPSAKGYVKMPWDTTKGSVKMVARAGGLATIGAQTIESIYNILKAHSAAIKEIKGEHSPERNARHNQLIRSIQNQGGRNIKMNY